MTRERRRRALSWTILCGGGCVTLAQASSNRDKWRAPPPPPPVNARKDILPEPYTADPPAEDSWNSDWGPPNDNPLDDGNYGAGQDPYNAYPPESGYDAAPEPSWPRDEEPWTANTNTSPPPPPRTNEPPPKYNPIHYNFPKEKVTEKRGLFGRRKSKITPVETGKPILDEDGIPDTILQPEEEEEELISRRRPPRDDNAPAFASPRRDVITRYQSTMRGMFALAMSSSAAGYMVGAFLGKSLLNNPYPLATAFMGIFLVCTLLRNPYGELVRALGMALILALQRTTSIRRRYPTWRHIQSSLGLRPRRNFPPSLNPWNYQPTRNNDPEFKMLYVLVAMMFVGSTCGGSIPLIPTWMGSLAGAGFFALTTTQQRAVGDLTRTMGMRVVALCEEILGINSELEILSKGAVVSGKIFDKLMIMDRKHRVKDRLIAGATFLYRQVSTQVNRVQSDLNRDDGDNRRDGSREGREDRKDDRDQRDDMDRRGDRRDDRGRRPDPKEPDTRPRRDPRDDDPRRRQGPTVDRRPPNDRGRGDGRDGRRPPDGSRDRDERSFR